MFPHFSYKFALMDGERILFFKLKEIILFFIHFFNLLTWNGSLLTFTLLVWLFTFLNICTQSKQTRWMKWVYYKSGGIMMEISTLSWMLTPKMYYMSMEIIVEMSIWKLYKKLRSPLKEVKCSSLTCNNATSVVYYD